MYCKNCGTNVGESKYCPNCGMCCDLNNYACTALNPTPVGEITAEKVESFDLITAYKSMFKKYAQFSGRSRRSEYWLASIVNCIIVMVMYMVIYIPIIVDAVNNRTPSTLTIILFLTVGLLWLIYTCVTLVPSLALSTRRLHDTGRSGWFLLLNLIPYVGSIIIFVFTVLDSQPGENKYGTNPKGF